MKVGWFLPLTLADPYFIAIKAGVAASLTAAMSMYIADNPDLVSACFIAIVCISPTPLLGLKSSMAQLLNSAIGGAWGILMRVIGLDMVFGVGVAVSLGIFCSFVARQSNFWVASAFSAYFVQVIDYGGIANTAKVRALALSVGSVCALVVNITTSLFFTKHIFGRRMQIAKNMVVRVLTVGKKEEKKRGIEVREEQAIDKEVKEEGGGDRGTSCDEYFQQLDGLDAMAQSIFAVLNTLLGELNAVSTEAKVLRLKLPWLNLHIFRARRLKQFLHLVVQFGYEVQIARDELPFSDHEQLFQTTSLFLDHLSQELSSVEVAKNREAEDRRKEANRSVEMRMPRLQDFPSEHLKRVAKELGWMIKEIESGTPTVVLKRSGEEPLLKEVTTNNQGPTESESTPHDPNQFYKDVGSAEASIASAQS